MQVTTDLQHAPAEIVRQFMIQANQASDPDVVDPTTQLPTGAWPAYKGVEPSTPDEVLTVTTTQGLDGGRTMIDGEVASHWGFQVRIRSSDDVDGFAKASSLRAWMQRSVDMAEITLDGMLYLIPCFAHIGQVLELGRDRPSTGRYICTLNAIAAIRVVTG